MFIRQFLETLQHPHIHTYKSKILRENKQAKLNFKFYKTSSLPKTGVSLGLDGLGKSVSQEPHHSYSLNKEVQCVICFEGTFWLLFLIH